MNLALHGFLLQVILSMILDSQHGFGLCSAGEPGYLDFDNLPETNFSCQGKVIGGYYADVEAGCQMFHVCTIGQKDEIMDIKFLCLNGTVFDQETRVCERVDEVDCSKSERFYNLNLELYGNNAVTLSLHEGEEDDGPSDSLDDYQHRTSSSRPSTTTTTTTTTSRPSQSSTTPSNNNYQQSTGYPQHYQPQPAFPSVQTSQSKSLYDDKNGGYHHQYIFHNDERNNNQATSYQLFSNQGVSSTVPTPHVHQVRYSSTPPQVIHNEPSTVTPLFHTSSTIQTLLNNNPNGASIINPIFHNHGIASTTEQYTVHNTNPRETSEYQDNDEEPDERDEHEEHEERRRLEPIQSTNKGKVSKLTISPVPQQESSRSVIQTKSSQTSQHHRISVNFLPTQTTIQTTSRTFYPTSRTSTKPQKSSNQRVMLQHIHVPPPPSIPNLKHHQITINLSPPDIQKIVQNPPPLLPSQSRVIVTAKASVSDESGRPLNTSQLITLPLPTIPSNYDDYREGDESFDPFYRDVPKIRNDHRIVVSSRSSRSPKWRILVRNKRDISNGNTRYYRKVDEEKSNASESAVFSVNRYNDTDISSIVENLRKFRNIFFGGDFDDSVDNDKLSESSPFTPKPSSDSEEPPKLLGSGLRNDNTQTENHLNKNVNSSTDKSHSKDTDGEEYMEADLRRNAEEYSQSPVQTKTASKISNPSINRRDLESEYYDSEDKIVDDPLKDRNNSESATAALKDKESEIEYYDNQDEVSTDRLKNIQDSVNLGTTAASDVKSKELEIEYYDSDGGNSNRDSEDKNSKTVKTSAATTTPESEMEEYVYDPDEPYLEYILTSTKTPIVEGTTALAQIDSKISDIEDPRSLVKKMNDAIVVENDSEDIAKKEKNPKQILDKKLTPDSTPTPERDLKSKGRENGFIGRSEISTTEAPSTDKIETSTVDAEEEKSEEKELETKQPKSESKSAKFEAKEIKLYSSTSTKVPEELLETKSSSHRNKPQFSESVDYSEERKIVKKGPSKSRRRNLIKSKHIQDSDYSEDEDLIDWEEERRERRKQNGGARPRKKCNSKSRSRPKDYKIEDARFILRSRSSSNRKSSSRDRRLNLARERVYQEVGRRRKPVSEELDTEELKSEEPDYQSEDYYTSEEIRSASLEEDYYDEDLEPFERERNERAKVQRNKSLGHEEPLPRPISNRRRKNNIKFSDEDLDYDSREASTLSSREDESAAGWSLEYSTSEDVPGDSKIETLEEDYTEESIDHGDVTTSAEDLTEEVTSSVENEKEIIEKVAGKTEGVLKFTDELPKLEQRNETIENHDEKPMKDGKESPMKDMRDYVDDNYEPENYKQHEKSKVNESAKQNLTDVQEKSDRKTEEVQLKEAKKTETTNEETNKTKLDESRLSETTVPPATVTVQPTTTTVQPTTTTAKTTRRITRFTTTKATAPTTPPKLFKPLTGRRNYFYIPPTTTPNPVVIKRKISLVHPRPAKPPKSYNELAPKPVIRKKLLEARKSIIATTVSSTTQQFETVNAETTLEPITTSETSALFSTTSHLLSDDKVNLENTTEMSKIIDDEKEEEKEEQMMEEQKMQEMQEKKEEQNVEEEKKEEKIEDSRKTSSTTSTTSTTSPVSTTSPTSTTSSTIENLTNYPYLLSRLSTLATPFETQGPNEGMVGQLTEEPTTLAPIEVDTTTKLKKMVPKTENLEPHSESTKAEVTFIKTSPSQKNSKRTTTDDSSSPSGSYLGFNCLGKEMYRFYGDKRDCRLFHYCSPGFTSTQVLDFKFVCEQGTYFDETSQSCRHDFKNPDCTVRIFW